jgi:hypothetical protein
MPDSLTKAIEARLERYLQGDESLAEFEAWLVPETWDISPQSDRAAHELATAITLRIAEFTNGDWSEAELRDSLADLPRPPLSPLILSTETFMYSGEKGEHAVLGSESHLARFAVAGTGRSEVAG